MFTLKKYMRNASYFTNYNIKISPASLPRRNACIVFLLI